MADTIDTVTPGHASLKGYGGETFHFAIGHKTLCGRDWYENSWIKMDTDVDVESLRNNSHCCARCLKSTRIAQ